GALCRLKPSVLYFVPGVHTPFRDLPISLQRRKGRTILSRSVSLRTGPPVPFSGRAALLSAALAGAGLGGRKEIKISSFEADLERVVYTYETVAHFRKLHPGAPLYFLLGSDCLAGFPGWRRPGFILKNARLLAGLRPGYAIRKNSGAPFTALAGRFPMADSTGIRAELFLGRRPAQLHRAVLDRIEEKALYLARERKLLKKFLSPGRYAHSLQTAELALRLAPGAGVPQQKAALAALLHDCARDLPPGERRRLFLKSAPRAALPGLTLVEAPVLAHAWAGAALAREKFGVKDEEVLEAIEGLGQPNSRWSQQDNPLTFTPVDDLADPGEAAGKILSRPL
ncbi:MAG: HD domain-containing protein, partial [Deltaproteobacteria bacterium]